MECKWIKLDDENGTILRINLNSIEIYYGNASGNTTLVIAHSPYSIIVMQTVEEIDALLGINNK